MTPQTIFRTVSMAYVSSNLDIKTSSTMRFSTPDAFSTRASFSMRISFTIFTVDEAFPARLSEMGSLAFTMRPLKGLHTTVPSARAKLVM